MYNLLEILDRPGASAGAILIAAAVAICVAVFTSWQNRRITQDRETLSLINDFSWDKDYIDAKDRFVEIRKGAGLESCLSNGDEIDRLSVAKIMNHYELLSVGMNTGILSEKVYERYYRTRFVQDWKEAQGYISAIRRIQNNEKLFVEFERLASKWEDKMNRPRKFPRF